MNAKPDYIKLLGEHRQRETFEVGNHQFVDFLSHGTVLEDCTIIIRGSSRNVVFHGATLRRCLIHTKRRLMNFLWHDVVLEECAFKGWFIGCDFGPRPDAYPDHPHGTVSSCDFSQAQLHLCRYFRSDLTQQKLPRWPCFTVLEPEANAADWLEIPFPENYRRVAQKNIAESTPGVVGSCEHAGEIAKKHDVSVEEIKALVSGKPYIAF